MKMFLPFSALVPLDFNAKMIDFWMTAEGIDKSTALGFYCDHEFLSLACRISGQRVSFQPDLGYSCKQTEGTLCFEQRDNSFVIPTSILIDPKPL